jgi:CRISPR-associated protein Csb2
MAMCAQQPPPEWLTGHKANGQPSPDAHLAMFPLPFVGARHADGRIMGLGLALPAGLDPKTAARCLGKFLYEPDSGLPRRTRLFDGKWFTCEVELETRESPPLSLQARPWIGPARVWASVTPVVLDRHFDGPQKWDRAGENVKDACERIGLPRPKEVVLHPVSLFEGVPHAKMFPGMIRKSDGGRRFHSHAVIIFEEPVQGPLLVGAGRFKGYGLCRPTAKGGD